VGCNTVLDLSDVERASALGARSGERTRTRRALKG